MRPSRPCAGALMGVLVVLLAASSAMAQPAVCSDALPDAAVRARLASLSRAVRYDEPPVRRWWTTFLFLHATMATSAAILAASAQDEGFRNEMLVGTTSSTLGFVSLVVFGPPMMGAGDTLRALPESTPSERLHKLRVVEDLFRRSSDNIEFLRSWFPATLSTLYVTAAASTLLLGFQRPTGAIIHSVGGAVLGLGRILLRPTSSRDIWRRYVRTHPDGDCSEAPSRDIAPSVAIMPHGLGLGLRIDF